GLDPAGVIGQPDPEGEVVDEQGVDRAGHDLARRELDHAAAADDGQVQVVLLAGVHEPEAHPGSLPLPQAGGAKNSSAMPSGSRKLTPDPRLASLVPPLARPT